MARSLALLRAVNVGNRKVPMADLRALAVDIGLGNPATFIASGNLLFDDNGDSAAAEAMIEQALRTRCGFDVPVIVRNAREWTALAAANPFPEAAASRPNLVMMALSKAPLSPGAAGAIEARARIGERVAASGGALWFDYATGVADSKLTPARIDRAAGSPTTARNWRSVVKLGELLAG